MPGPWTSWVKDEDFAKDAKIEIWDVVQAKVLDDNGRDQGEVLLRRAGPPHAPTTQPLVFGDIGVFEFLGSSDDYYAWWMMHGAEQWTSSQPMVGKYHLCKEDVAKCQAKAKWAGDHPGGIVHFGEYRLVWPGDLKGIKWVRGPKKKRVEEILGENWDKPAEPTGGEGRKKEAERDSGGGGGGMLPPGELGGEDGGEGRERGSFGEAVDDLRRDLENRGGAPERRSRSRRRGDRRRSSKVRDAFGGGREDKKNRREKEADKTLSPERKEGGQGRDGDGRKQEQKNRRSRSRRRSKGGSRRRSPSRGEGRGGSRGRSRRRSPSRSEDKKDRWKRGPFGSGPTTRGSRSPSADFRDASPSSRRHSHQRLVEFSSARPGQLAQRLLTKMDKLVRTGGRR